MRQLTVLDRCIDVFDQGLRTLCADNNITQRANPAVNEAAAHLSATEMRHVAGLMRVDHAGEVCAQALYQSQGITARHAGTRQAMRQAALEEWDHMGWCESRLQELGSHKSYLNPVWYGGAFVMGSVTGMLGDTISLGFVAETERQVAAHLLDHLNQLPSGDAKSRAILQQMREDEMQHGTQALAQGGVVFPWVVRWGMKMTATVMTRIAYWV